MNVLFILSELKKNNIFPKLTGDNLKLVGDIQKLSPEHINLIKSHQAAIISFLRTSSDQSTYVPIKTYPIQRHYPLTHSQKRMWILSQFEGGSAAYNMIASLYLKGVLDVEKFNEAFNQMIARHDSLRTVFKLVNNEPRQVILDVVKLNLQLEELNDDTIPCLQQEIINSQSWDFNLENGPLIRIKLYKISTNETAMIFGMHHLVGDGWSISVLIQEVMDTYKALCENRKSDLAPLRIQYKDYTYWLAERLETEKLVLAKNFWAHQFGKPIEPLHLPTDFPRPNFGSFEGGLSKFYFDDQQYQIIQQFCKDHQVTPFNFFLACLNLLLYKLSYQETIVIGTPVSGRNHFDLHNQIGLYINTIALPLGITPGEKFSNFLQSIASASLKAFEFQDYPIDSLLEELGTKRDMSRNALFDVMMVLQNTALGDGSVNFRHQHGFELSLLDDYLYGAKNITKEHINVKFDLCFNFSFDLSKRVNVEIEYKTSLFKKSSIERFYKYYQSILQQVLADPSKQLKNIVLADAEEQETILKKFNRPVEDFPERSIPELLAAVLDLYGNKTAIVVDQTSFTYQEVKKNAERITNYLRSELKPCPNPRVALLLQRNEQIIYSILGILHAGAAYLPIDITYPTERINYMLEDALPVMILVDEEGKKHVPADYKGKVVDVANIPDAPKVNHIAISDEAAAYFIYTSGSTGKPKGVEITHKNTVAFLKWAKEEFRNTPYDILYAATSYCFDLSVFEYFLPLMQGKTIRILNSALDIPYFLEKEKKVFINTVPSVVGTLIDQKIMWDGVAALNMAGEIAPKAFKKQLDFHKMEVRNLYGPSEDTTYSTMYRFTDDDTDDIPIGNPITYTQLYILDPSLNIVPIGVEGEIYLSGHSVAKGYLNKPEQSRERFIPNPYLKGLMMYKTGDLGKWRPNGQVDFIGRTDEQVKLRGYRIELQEINLALLNCHGVEDAHTRVIDNSLVSWVVKKDCFLEDIQQKLKRTLPHYMVPSSIERIDFMPRNANGKIDFAQLQNKRTAPTTHDDFPKNETERQLVVIWEQVLQKKGVGIRENFFELGGDSLRMQKCLFHIRNTFQKDLSFRELYTAANIEAIAQLLHLKKQQEGEIIQIQESQIDSETVTYLLSYLLVLGVKITEDANTLFLKDNTMHLHTQIHELIEQNKEIILQQLKNIQQKKDLLWPASYLQNNVWRFLETKGKYSNMRFGYCLHTPLDLERLQNTFYKVIERHEILRTKFFLRGDVLFQKVQALNRDKFKIRHAIALNLAEVHEICEQAASNVFNYFDDEPLITCTSLINRENGSQILFFVVNHLVFDGISIGIFVDDLLRFYTDTTPPTPLRFQFKEYIAYQKFLEHTYAFKLAKEYWEGVFAKPYEVIPFRNESMSDPIQGPNVLNTVLKTVSISGPQLEHLRTYCYQAQCTMSSFFQALYMELIKQLSEANDIFISANISNRENGLIDDQVGLFTNSIFLRYEQLADIDFLDLLKKVSGTLVTALGHNQYYSSNRVFNELNLNERYGHEKLRKFVYNHVQTASAVSAPKGIHASEFNIPTDKIGCYYLLLYINEMDDQVQVILEGNGAKFSAESMNEMVDNITSIFSKITSEHPVFFLETV